MGQMLFTQDGSPVEVEQVWVVSARQDAEGQWIQMGGRVALMPNGAYCHGDGNLLPFEDEEEIRQIFTSRDREGNPCILPEMQVLMDMVLEWFAHRAEFDDQIIKKVVPFFGGSGGGRPNMAQAGCREPMKVTSVFEDMKKIVKESILI